MQLSREDLEEACPEARGQKDGRTQDGKEARSVQIYISQDGQSTVCKERDDPEEWDRSF